MDEMMPPANEDVQGSPMQPPAPVEPVQAPPPPGPAPAGTPKPRTDAGFFIIGFFTPILAYIALTTLVTSFLPASGAVPGSIGFLVILFLVFLWLFIAGRNKGDVRLRSMGKGGLWACVGIPLLTLLAFGTCMVAGVAG